MAKKENPRKDICCIHQDYLVREAFRTILVGKEFLLKDENKMYSICGTCLNKINELIIKLEYIRRSNTILMIENPELDSTIQKLMNL